LLEVEEDGEKAVFRRRRPLVRRGGAKDWKREVRILTTGVVAYRVARVARGCSVKVETKLTELPIWSCFAESIEHASRIADTQAQSKVRVVGMSRVEDANKWGQDPRKKAG